jgi:hypothetical protein
MKGGGEGLKNQAECFEKSGEINISRVSADT